VHEIASEGDRAGARARIDDSLTARSSLSPSLPVFIAWNLIQGAVFIVTRNSGTGTPAISDTYPDIANVEGALDATNVWCEVIATMSLVLVLLQCPGALGRAMAMTVTVALTGYHYSQGIMPPPPVVVLATVSAVASWMAFAAKKKAKSS
jgi:hypothetical protein